MMAREDELVNAQLAMTAQAEFDHLMMAMKPEVREEFQKVWRKLRE